MADWQTMQDAIAAWVKGRTGVAVQWADQDSPQPPRPFINLSIIAGPTTVAESDEVREAFEVAASDITITPEVEDEETYTVEIDGELFSFESDADATAEEICAGLVDAINDEDTGSEVATATDNEDGTFELAHVDEGEVFELELSGNLEYSNNDEGHELELTVCGMRSITVSIQAVTEDSAPPNDAVSLLEKAHTGLRLPSVLEALSVAGLAVNERLPVQRIPQTEGSQRIDRAAFDVRMTYAENTTERIGYIETVEVDVPEELGV